MARIIVPLPSSARQARLVDGASEVHKMVLAKNYLAEGNDFWRWGP